MYTVSNTDPPVVLRPEGTAGVMRALANVGLTKRATANGTRVWYAGPMFRRERPQAKRWRQFWQMGVEAVRDPAVSTDAEVIELAMGFLREHAKVPVRLRLNTLGTKKDRQRFNDELREWLKERYWAISKVSRERYDAGNCMRILDSKLAEDIDALRGAPRLPDFVAVEERERFEELQALLREAGIEFKVDEKLVRGLDYYTSTAFEFDGETGKAVCAGGRYMDVIGASGVGFAIGLDRLEDESWWEKSGAVEAYERDVEGGVAIVGHAKDARRSESEIGQICRRLGRELRKEGVRTGVRLSGSGLGKVVSRAIHGGARAVVVVGPKDVKKDCAQLKIVLEDVGNGTGDLEEIELESVVERVCAEVGRTRREK